MFWVPPSDQYLSMPEHFVWRTSEEDWADSEARFFRVADRFMQELGWLG